MLVLNGREVETLLSLPACIDLMETTLRGLAIRKSAQPLRMVMDVVDGEGQVALMPAHLSWSDTLGFKVISVFPGNRNVGRESHQGLVGLFDSKNGNILAIVDGTSITAIRTAAVSAVATRALSAPDSRTLAVLGAGTQALWHIEAIRLVRHLDRIRVWSRTRESAERLVGTLRPRLAREQIDVAATAAEALAGAAIIVTATTSRDAILQREWISVGAHVNAIGSCVPTARELDGRTMADARLIVDSREAALAEAGDIIIAIQEGAIDESCVRTELGDVLLGTSQGRSTRSDLTVFESVGLGAEDVAAAAYVYEVAARENHGAQIQL